MARTVEYQFTGDTSRLDRSIQNLNNQMQSMGATAQRVGSQMSTYISAPIAALGGVMVKFASDAEQANAKTQTVFGETANAVSEWADEMSTELGTSSNQMQKFATDMADMLIPMGAGQEEATKMSQNLSTLAVDLAAMNDVTQEQAFNDLQSALAGSSETMNKYGANTKASAVNQELLNMGIAGGNSAATEAQKAMARYRLIMQDTTSAQGAAARTADTFGGQMRIMRGQLQDLAVEMGTHLLPIVTGISRVINQIIGTFRSFSDTTQQTIIIISALVGVIGPLLAGFGFLTTTVIPAMTAGLVALKVGFLALFSPIAGAIALVAAVGAAAYLVIDNWSNVSNFFATLFNGIMQSGRGFVVAFIGLFRKVSNNIKTFIFGALDTIIGKVQSFLTTIGAGGLAESLNPISDGIGSAMTNASNEIDRANEEIMSGLSDMNEGAASVTSSISGAVNDMTDSVIESATNAKDSLYGLFETSNETEISQSGGSGSSVMNDGNESSSPSNENCGGNNANDFSGSKRVEGLERLDQKERELMQKRQERSQRHRQLQRIGQDLLRQTKNITMELGNAIGKSLTGAIFEGKNAFEAFGKAVKGILKDLISQLISAVAQALILSAITGGLSAGSALGNVFGGFSQTVAPTNINSSSSINVNVIPSVLPSGDIVFSNREGVRRNNRVGR